MAIDALLRQIKEAPKAVDYQQLLAVIDKHYHYQATAFRNGEIDNAAGQNEISCKLFSFALLHGLNQQQTLACFGSLYFDVVLSDPNGVGHQNIRQFMKTGWQALEFFGQALITKPQIVS